MPVVSGQSLEQATEALAGVGLRVGAVTPRATNDHEAGRVLEQGPSAQALVSKGTAVALVVAAPKAVDLTKHFTVRDVGQSGTVAAAACAAAMSAALAIQGRPMELSMRYIHERSNRVEERTGDGAYLETVFYVARQHGAPPEAPGRTTGRTRNCREARRCGH